MLRRTRLLLAVFAAATLAAACAETDAGITTKVKTRLAADDTVKAYQIDVDTKDKVVTLNGTVDSEVAKERAVMVARETTGVASVVDNITVAGRDADLGSPGGAGTNGGTNGDGDRAGRTGSTFDDGSITVAVKAKLVGDPDVSGLKIDVDTADGVVTLSGDVKSQAQRDEAVRLARETDGVRDVKDKLTVSAR
jgi:osmotically-inducible protein OsmY